MPDVSAPTVFSDCDGSVPTPLFCGIVVNPFQGRKTFCATSWHDEVTRGVQFLEVQQGICVVVIAPHVVAAGEVNHIAYFEIKLLCQFVEVES